MRAGLSPERQDQFDFLRDAIFTHIELAKRKAVAGACFVPLFLSGIPSHGARWLQDATDSLILSPVIIQRV